MLFGVTADCISNSFFLLNLYIDYIDIPLLVPQLKGRLRFLLVRPCVHDFVRKIRMVPKEFEMGPDNRQWMFAMISCCVLGVLFGVRPSMTKIGDL